MVSIFSHTDRLSQALASFSCKCGENVVSRPGKDVEEREELSEGAVLASDYTLNLLTYCSFSLFRPSLFLFNLYSFDEPPLPAVTMTESHTRCTTRGLLDSPKAGF